MKNINSLISFLNEQESEDKSKIIINMIRNISRGERERIITEELEYLQPSELERVIERSKQLLLDFVNYDSEYDFNNSKSGMVRIKGHVYMKASFETERHNELDMDDLKIELLELIEDTSIELSDYSVLNININEVGVV